MDLVFYPSSTPSVLSNRSTWKFHVISLTLVAIATTMSIASIVLSVTQWDKSRSLIDDGSTFEGQGPRTTGSSSAVCLPCSAILDAGSTTEERLMSEFYFARNGFNSREEEEVENSSVGGDGRSWSSGNKDTCCAKGGRKLRWLLTMFLNVRTRQIKEHGLNEGTSERTRCLVFPSVEHSADNGTRCIVGKREAADAAHLTGARAASTTGSAPPTVVGLTVLEWTNPSVLQGRVESNIADRLTCRSEGGGVYFVYSQVYFVDYDDDDDERTTIESVTVYVNRFVNQTKRSEVLTQRSESRCSRSTLTSASPCEYTVYAGSLVELTEGDSVYVTVSHPSFVNPDAKVTYFGLQKVT